MLKTSLIVRHSRGLILTREGEIWFKYVKKALAELEVAKTLVAEDSQKVQGEIRVTTTFGFASTVLFPYLADFAELYPDVRLNLICNDDSVDLNMREADVAITPVDFYDPSLVQTYLTTRKLGVYANAEYLEKFGVPTTLKDLDSHRLIIFLPVGESLKKSMTNWLLKAEAANGQLRSPYMILNSVECTAQAAGRGLGIITLSQDSLLIKEHNLTQILQEIKSPRADMHYIYPESLKTVKIIKALESYLIKAFQKSNTRS